jgi:ABC-2 type transport system ATP-binding protein
MLRTREMCFEYGLLKRRRVFENFSWVVPEGKRTLLLGANGAGKSTLLRLLSGFVAPKDGAVVWADDPSRRALFRNVGWMPQDISPARGLRVSEQVAYSAWLSGRDSKAAHQAARDALDLVRLVDQADQLSATLSGGQLRRLGLAQTIVTDSPVVLLDEPTAGLDPAQTKVFREIVREMDVAGGLVVSTHQVGDVSADFDHVCVLSAGSIVFDGAVAEFQDLGRTLGLRSTSVEDVFTYLVAGGMH